MEKIVKKIKKEKYVIFSQYNLNFKLKLMQFYATSLKSLKRPLLVKHS